MSDFCTRALRRPRDRLSRRVSQAQSTAHAAFSRSHSLKQKVIQAEKPGAGALAELHTHTHAHTPHFHPLDDDDDAQQMHAETGPGLPPEAHHTNTQTHNTHTHTHTHTTHILGPMHGHHATLRTMTERGHPHRALGAHNRAPSAFQVCSTEVYCTVNFRATVLAADGAYKER